MSEVLVKTDRNGTKYFDVTEKCPKCGGTGLVRCYIPVNGGVCYDCGGSGISRYTKKVYTPEYMRKKEAAAKAKLDRETAAKKATAAADNLEFYPKHGFNENGVGYIIIDANTYEIKDEIKEAGGKFNGSIKEWILPQPWKDNDCMELSVDEVYYKDYTDHYRWNNTWRADDEVYISVMNKISEAKLKNSKSNFIGEVGERKLFKAVYTEEHHYDSYYGTTYVYKFMINDDVVCWKTTKFLGFDTGIKVLITGTIKEHSCYNNERVTYLTRCKVMEEENE